MTQQDSTMARVAQDHRGIWEEFPCPASQFCASPWCHTRVVVERGKDKIIIIFDFLLHLLTIVLHVCSICLLKIYARRLPYTGHRGPGLGNASTIYFMTFARMMQAPTGSRMRSSRPWGPTRTHLHLRRSRWRLGRVEDQPAVALCALEAPPPSRTHG